MFINVVFYLLAMAELAVKLDRIAIPFWIILIIYSIYEITHSNPGAWLVLVIIAGALILDIISVIKNRKK